MNESMLLLHLVKVNNVLYMFECMHTSTGPRYRQSSIRACVVPALEADHTRAEERLYHRISSDSKYDRCFRPLPPCSVLRANPLGQNWESRVLHYPLM